MSTQSGKPDSAPPHADPSRVHGDNPQKPTERAFVVQFDTVNGVRGRLRGRVEVVASGEGKRFRSLKELIAFMVCALRRRATEPRD